MKNDFLENLVKNYEERGKENIRHYKNQVLMEIRETIVDIEDTLLIEKFNVLEKYISIFDELIVNVSNAQNITQIRIFKDSFKSEYCKMLKEFKEEYLKKYSILVNDIDTNSYNKVKSLYTKLNSVRSLKK